MRRNCHTGGDGAARRIDIQPDVLLRIFGSEHEHLCTDDIRVVVLHFRAQPDDALLSSRLKIGSVGLAGASSAAMTGRIALELLNLVSFGNRMSSAYRFESTPAEDCAVSAWHRSGSVDAAVRIVRAAASFTATAPHAGAHAWAVPRSRRCLTHACVLSLSVLIVGEFVRHSRQLRKPPHALFLVLRGVAEELAQVERLAVRGEGHGAHTGEHALGTADFRTAEPSWPLRTIALMKALIHTILLGDGKRGSS